MPGTPTADAVCNPGSAYRQFGTSAMDAAYAVAAAPGGGVYVVGGTAGLLDAAPVGNGDSFLRRYDEQGNVVWTRQFGYPGPDVAREVTVDAAGNVIVLGTIEGFSAGYGPAIYLRKFDASGTELEEAIGETLGEEPCYAEHFALDPAGGSVALGVTDLVLSGEPSPTADVCVQRYDSAGQLEWTRRAGSPAADGAGGLALTANGGLVVAGWTDGDLDGPSSGGRDAFVWALDDAGNERWIKQLGTPAEDGAARVAASASRVYVAGWTKGDLAAANAGEEDVFLRELGPDGLEVATAQFGTSAAEVPTAILVDNSRLILAARVQTPGAGGPSIDGLLLVHRSQTGAFQRVTDSASAAYEPRALALSGLGQIFLAGSTYEALAGENQGGADAFVARLPLIGM